MKTATGRIGIMALAAMLAGSLTAQAAVEAVQITLSGDSGSSSYEVPAGKVLIIECIVFTDYWDYAGEPKVLSLRHAGLSTGGLVWDTDLTYSINYNSFLRPLRLREGIGLSISWLGASYKCFIYGMLADATDLYAAIPSEFRDVRVASATPGALEARLHTASPRPRTVRIEGSTDLQSWANMAGVRVTETADRSDVQVEFDASTKDFDFARAIVRARMQGLLPSLP